MPFTNDKVKDKSTKQAVLELLEQRDEETKELMWWSINEICEEVDKKSGTVHYHLNPFREAGLLEIGHPKDSHLTPVYRIKEEKWEDWLKLKEEILEKERTVYERAKLRDLDNKQAKRTVIEE